GVPGGKTHRVVATHRVAHQRHPDPAQPVHQGEQIAREILGGVGRWSRPLAPAVAALVEGNHVEPVSQGRHDPIEPVGVRGAAMLSGYGLLAPERLGLLMESEPPARVVASINPRVSDQPPAPPAKTLQTARLTPDARRARARPVPDVRPAPQPAQPERPRGT